MSPSIIRVRVARSTMSHAPGSIAERWARYVFCACESASDVRTLHLWARAAAISCTTLSETCRLLGIRPHAARDFTRVLRAIVHSCDGHHRPHVYLDVSDRRTLRALEALAGVDIESPAAESLLERFFAAQQFIDARNEGLAAVHACLFDQNSVS